LHYPQVRTWGLLLCIRFLEQKIYSAFRCVEGGSGGSLGLTKPNKMNKSILLFCALLFVITATSQKLQKCSLYSFASDSYQQFNYSVSYSGTDGLFATTYYIYNSKRRVKYKVVATHVKGEKRVTVSVTDEQSILGEMFNYEKTEYQTPTLKPFGFRGNVGGLGGKHVPNQLTVKFVSAKYEHVQVLSVLGSYANGDFKFFVF
jgi:hypothetical protein